MKFKKYNRKLGLMLSIFLFISTILTVLVIPLPITKAAPTYSWSTFTITASGDDVEFLADNGWTNYTTDENNLWVHSNEYTTYAWLRFEGLGAITNAGGIIDQIILGIYSGVDEGADYNEVPGGYVSVACPMFAWDFELSEANILAADMNPVASFDGDYLSPSGAWYNKTISNNDPRDWYAWSTDFNDVFTCYVAGFMEYSPDWTYYRSFTSFDEGHPAKLYVKYHIGEGYEEVLAEFGAATYVQTWGGYNIWNYSGSLGYPLDPMEYTFQDGDADPYEILYDNITGDGPYFVGYSNESAQATGMAGNRKTVRTNNGTLYTVGRRKDGSTLSLFVSKSINNGVNWIDETTIQTWEDPHVTSGQGSLAVDSEDNLHLAWSGENNEIHEVMHQVWYSKFNGSSWSTPIIISVGLDSQANIETGIAVDSSNNVHVVWVYVTGNQDIYYVNYTDSWSSPLVISTGVAGMTSSRVPAIAVDSEDYIHVTFSAESTAYPNPQIWHTYYSTSWNTPVRIGNYTGMSSYNQFHSGICVDENDMLHVAFGSRSTGHVNDNQIWYVNSTSPYLVADWSIPLHLNTDVLQDHDFASIALDSNETIHIIWSSWTNLWYVNYTDAWSTPETRQTGVAGQMQTLRWARFPEGKDGGFVATAPNGTVITPDPFETPEEVLDFVKDWDSTYGPACSFNGATLYEADGVTVKTDGWLFMGEVYVVKAEIRNFTTFYLELDDGENTVLFNYVNATKSLNVEASEFVAGLVQGTVTTLNAEDEEYELAWKFILNKNILDVPIGQNITYYGVNVPQDSHLSGTAITGLMIYNLGGHVTYEFQGDAGRRIGGDALEIHHTNSTGNGAYVDVIFRRLQHVHLAFSLDVEDNDCFDVDENSGYVQFGFKYWDGSEWDDLYYVEMSIVNGAVDPVAGDGKAFIIPYVSWNSRQSDGNMTLVKSDTLSGYPECADDVNSQITYSKFYLDLWFNTMNSSTTVGGRMSTKYFGMDESTSWFFWSNWKPVMVNQTESMFYDDLRDEDGDILQISDIELVQFFARVFKAGAGSGSCDSHTWGIVDPEFSKTLAADRMQAINTPDGIDTLVLDMPSTGFLQPIAKAIEGIGNMIWQGALNFVKILIASMDTIFLWIGFPAGTFSQISTWVLTIPDFMIALIGYFGDVLASMIIQVGLLFSIITVGLPQLIYGTGLLVTTIVAYLTQLISLFTGGWSGVSDMWTGLELGQWLELFFIGVLPFMWLARIESSSDGFKTAREDIGFVFKLVFVLIELGSWLIQTIGTILQAIRNILPI